MKQKRKQLYMPLLMICVIVLSAGAFLFCYRYDNKYTWRGVQPSDGVLTLEEQTLTRCPVLYLVDGWEIYQYKLLTPDDFAEDTPAPDQIVSIGQYDGFELADKSKNPHGSATYRLTLNLPPEKRSYMLELPEIFSAYNLYIDDKLAAVYGNPDPVAYRPETGNGTVVFEAADTVQIIFAVTDYSHFYSGMIYPPSFGEPEAVSRLLDTRLILRALMCGIALMVGVISLAIGILIKNTRLTALYGLVCLFFVGFTCYPIIKTLCRSGVWWYAVEDFCYAAMILAIMLLQNEISSVKSRWLYFFIGFGAYMCVASPIASVFFPQLRLVAVGVAFIVAYKVLSAVYVTVTAAIDVYRGANASIPLLCGMLVFACALVMSSLLPPFQPILFGWYVELAGFVLVLSVGTVMMLAVFEQHRARTEAEDHAHNVSQLLEIQRGYYPMMAERINEISVTHHDLRHHLNMVGSFIRNGEYQRLLEYTEALHEQRKTPFHHCEHYVANVILHYYDERALAAGIETAIRADIPGSIEVSDADICAVLSNLLENAIEACSSIKEGKRWLTIETAWNGTALVIEVENSYDGYAELKGRRFMSRKTRGREGIGLESVRIMSEKYRGSVVFEPESERRAFHSSVMLNAPKSEASLPGD